MTSATSRVTASLKSSATTSPEERSSSFPPAGGATFEKTLYRHLPITDAGHFVFKTGWTVLSWNLCLGISLVWLKGGMQTLYVGNKAPDLFANYGWQT